MHLLAYSCNTYTVLTLAVVLLQMLAKLVLAGIMRENHGNLFDMFQMN